MDPSDPSLPVETLPDPIMSFTVSFTHFVEAIGAPIPPALLHTPVVEAPIWSPTPQPIVFGTSCPTEKYEPFPGKYRHQSTDHLPVWPVNINDHDRPSLALRL